MKKILFVLMFVAFACLALCGFNVSTAATTSNEIYIEGAQVRVEGTAGIRFVGKISDSFDAEEVTAYGFALAFGETDIDNIVIGGTVNGKSVLCTQVSDTTEEGNYYVNLIDIPDTMYGQKVTARTYFIKNGEVIYSDSTTVRSLGQVTLAVKKAGQTSDLIEEIYNVVKTNYKNIYTDMKGNKFVTSSIYETRPANLEIAFISDWNNKFGTSMTEFNWETWRTSACEGATPMTATSDTNCSGTNAYEFFNTDPTTSAKWSWLLTFLLEETFTGVHPLRQITALLGDGTASDDWGKNMQLFNHLSRSLYNFFSGTGANVGNGDIDIVISDLTKYAKIADYNNVILAEPVELVKVGNTIELPVVSVNEAYSFKGYENNSNVYNDSYVVTESNIVFKPVITANEYTITFMNGEEEVTSFATTYTVEDDVELPQLKLDGYDFLGWYEDSSLSGEKVSIINVGTYGNKVYYASLAEKLYDEVNITYDLNGGYFRYSSVDAAIADFLTDYNAYGNYSYTADTFSALGAWTLKRESQFFYNATYKEKWSWLVDYIATVASDANKSVFENFYEFDTFDEMNAADGNYQFMFAYELRAWVGKMKYTANSSYITADYSSVDVKTSALLAALGQTSYELKEPCDLLVPSKDNDTFVGWKSSIDGTVSKQYPGYKKNPGDIVYTAVYKSEASGVLVANTITYDLDGGYFQYETVEAAIADFLKDFNAYFSTQTSYTGVQYTPETFYALGSWSQPIGQVSNFFYSATYKAKWTWLVNYIASVAGTNNKKAFTNFYNYTSQSELNSANSNYIYSICYELRGWVAQKEYSKNASFVTADYSSSSVKASALAAAKGQTTYTYTNACDLLTPKKSGYVFQGWVSSLDGKVYTTYPGYTAANTIVYTAKWVANPKVLINGTSYDTVAAALEAANAGDTIYVPAGTYDETLTISKDNIKIVGANDGNLGSGARAVETIFTKAITVSGVSGVEISGCKFTGGSAKVILSAGTSNFKFEYNVVESTSAAIVDMESTTGTVSNISVNYNYSSAYNGTRFIRIRSIVDGLEVKGNDITAGGAAYDFLRVEGKITGTVNIINNKVKSFIQSGVYALGVGVLDCTIKYNSFENITNTALDFRAMKDNGAVNYVIENNTFKNVANTNSGWNVIRIRTADYDANDTISIAVNNNKFIDAYYLEDDVYSFVENPAYSTQSNPFKVIYTIGRNYYEIGGVAFTSLTNANFTNAAISFGQAYATEAEVPGF